MQQNSETIASRESRNGRKPATVAVIIPTYNQARFLAESIKSVLAQTHAADEIIVVDDGSTDDPESVLAEFPKIQFIRQTNRGPSAARNIGLRSSKSNYIVFLDGDDRLLPSALEAGLACMADRPDCAFVYGGLRRIGKDGRPISRDTILPVEGDGFLALVRRYEIGVPATLFRRDCLLAVGGFDESLRDAEDYDLHLRLAWKYPIASHPETVFEYRMHGKNASDNHAKVLHVALDVLRRHEKRVPSNTTFRTAFRQGRAGVTKFRVSAMLTDAAVHWNNSHNLVTLTNEILQAGRFSPKMTIGKLFGALRRRLMKLGRSQSKEPNA